VQVASTGISGRTPSSIRTADPSCIARNKIAELELRLEHSTANICRFAHFNSNQAFERNLYHYFVSMEIACCMHSTHLILVTPQLYFFAKSSTIFVEPYCKCFLLGHLRGVPGALLELVSVWSGLHLSRHVAKKNKGD